MPSRGHRSSGGSKHVEYRPKSETELWKVEMYRDLSFDMGGVSQEDLPEFHAVMSAMKVEWEIARMIYGINPIVPPPDVDANFMRTFTIEEVAARFDQPIDEIESRYEIIITTWRQHLASRPPKTLANAVVPIRTDAELRGDDIPQITDEGERQIKKAGFVLRFFDVPNRPEEFKNVEMVWFAERCIELKKMFEDPMAKSLVRQALLNEMHMRRADDAIATTPIESKTYWQLQDTKLKLESIYLKQWADLEEICPYIKGAVAKKAFAGVVSDLIECWRAWKLDKNNEPIDGLFTAFEVQIEIWQSVQQGPQYRPGLVASINEAKKHLNDPTWKPKIPITYYRLLDETFRLYNAKMVEAGVINPIDLEADGPKGEYPPLFEAEPELLNEDEVIMSAEPVEILDAPPEPEPPPGQRKSKIKETGEEMHRSSADDVGCS